MVIASQAWTFTFGLAVTFGGIGVIATGIIIYMAVQIRGERLQNEEYRKARRMQSGT